MKRICACIALLFAVTVTVFAQNGAIQGHSYLGGTQSITQGLKSTNYANGIIPAATITVYLTGTTTKATIYSDVQGDTLSNPFTSNAVGANNPGGWVFFSAVNQGVDVIGSGGGANPNCTTAPNCYAQPVTLCKDCYPSSSLSPVSGVTTVQGIAPIQSNGQSGVPASGAVTISCTDCTGTGLIAAEITPPVAGQYVVLLANAAPVITTSNCTTITASSTSPFAGSIDRFNSSSAGGCTTFNTGLVWTGFTLPSGISPSNVTAVYGGVFAQTTCAGNSPINQCGVFGATGNGITISTPTNSWPTGSYAAQIDAGTPTSFDFATANIAFVNDSSANWIGSGPYGGVGTATPYLIVYYTGTPISQATNQLYVAPPLNVNQGILSLPVPFDVAYDTGTSTAYAATIPGYGPITANTHVYMVPLHANTSTTPTFALNGGSALTIEGPTGGALSTSSGGDIQVGQPAQLVFSGQDNKWKLLNPLVSGGGGSSVTWPPSNDIVVSNGTNSPAGLAPGAANNCAVSNGTVWQSTTCPGGGGGGSQIPSNANFVFTGQSANDDDSHVLSPAVAISSWSTTGGTTTVTATSHGFTVGQWISMRAASGWPAAPSAYTLGTGYTLFQVLSSGLTTNQFEISTSLISAGSCVSSCGSAYNAMGYLPFTTTAQAVFPSGSLNRTYMFLPSDVTIRGLNSGFSAMFASSGTEITCPVSVPTYLNINSFSNDVSIGRTAAQIESDYQGVFAQAHTCGMIVIANTAPAVNINQQFDNNVYANFVAVQRWLRGQGKSQANSTQFAAKEYWDLGADVGGVLNDAFDPNTYNQSTFGPNGGGIVLAAQTISNAMATGSGVAMPTQIAWFGNISDTETTAANGITYTPSADGFRAFKWTNAADNAIVMYLDTHTTPYVWNFNGLTSVSGDTDTTALPLALLSNSASHASVGNSIVQWEHDITPNGTQSFNLNVGKFVSGNYSAFLGIDYENTTASSALNSFILNAGGTVDAFHATPGGAVCFYQNTANQSAGQQGCPTGATYVFGVGGSGSTPPPFRSDSSGNITVASCTGCSGGSGISNITIAVTGGTQGANSCSSPATATMTGLTTSGAGSHLTSAYTTNPSSLTGWGSTGGMVFQAWPSAANTVSWIVCNQTATSITYSSITFSMGAQ